MQAGFAANRERRSNDALQYYTEAVKLAEQLNAPDRRLVVSLGELGRVTMGLKRFDEANAIYQRQLKVVEQTARPQSPEMIEPLENLGMNAMYQQSYASSRAYLTRSLDLATKNYGEKNSAVATGMHKIALRYFVQQDYANAEVWLLKAVKIDDEISGYDGFQGLADVNTLCVVYERGGKPDKAASCYAQLVAITGKQYGPDSPFLAQPLTAQANALRKIGRNNDAAAVEQRINALQPSARN
jgi:Tfp pilus assembly protein PilF